MAALTRRTALGFFAAVVLAAPLLFGATDRLVQIGLLAALGIGFLLAPPAVPRLARPVKWSIALALALVFGKEFFPAPWFGGVAWRDTLAQGFGVVFPPFHNPEPGRAVDAILAAAVAGAWFVWVRSFTAERKERLLLGWCMFGACAVFAVVCLALGTRTDAMILGIRYTPGWTGFGLFPNRNHTAAFLAMGALVGCGCTSRAGRRRHWPLLVAGLLGIGLIFVALLESRSRGGLLGFACGLCVFGALSLSKLRSRAALASAAAAGFLSIALLLTFGGKVLARFGSQTEGNIPNNVRWGIWHDAITMWRDAPLFGHGLGTFPQLFPFYQSVVIEDATVLHPESSWLLWAAELGAVAVALGAAALAFFIWKNMRGSLAAERGFFLRAGALAAVVALLCHAVWDVPAHRWATAGFALAALAIACPPRARAGLQTLSRAVALVPLGIAAFWLMPFLAEAPAWSPESLRRLLVRNALAPAPQPDAALETSVRFFPLSPALHQAIGVHALLAENRPAAAWREFRIADRLAPGSWNLAASQAWIARRFSPGMALNYWSIAIERAGRHEEEIFRAAYLNTCDLAAAEPFWNSYLARRPEFLLSYAGCLSGADAARAAYARWWQARVLAGAELKPFEREQFAGFAEKWSDPEQLAVWMKMHRGWEPRDFRQWAALLHGWGRDDLAWPLLARWIPEPQFPAAPAAAAIPVLESRWQANPADAVTAQALAAAYARGADSAGSRRVVLGVAEGKNAPAWFLQKAAYLRASEGDYAAAVTTLLGKQGD